VALQQSKEFCGDNPRAMKLLAFVRVRRFHTASGIFAHTPRRQRPAAKHKITDLPGLAQRRTSDNGLENSQTTPQGPRLETACCRRSRQQKKATGFEVTAPPAANRFHPALVLVGEKGGGLRNGRWPTVQDTKAGSRPGVHSGRIRCVGRLLPNTRRRDEGRSLRIVHNGIIKY